MSDVYHENMYEVCCGSMCVDLTSEQWQLARAIKGVIPSEPGTSRFVWSVKHMRDVSGLSLKSSKFAMRAAFDDPEYLVEFKPVVMISWTDREGYTLLTPEQWETAKNLVRLADPSVPLVEKQPLIPLIFGMIADESNDVAAHVLHVAKEYV